MKDKVLATIQEFELLTQGDWVTVGLSGGADSVALLCVLSFWREKLGISLAACHVNHRLRGAESDADEAFCRSLCERLEIPLTVTAVDVAGYAARTHHSTEEAARILRYQALAAAAGAGKIATAHNADDQAETVLFQLMRGTGLDGLCGIPPRRENIIRPLLDCTRTEIEGYLAGIGQPFCTDATNLSDDYTRNRIRHRLLPLCLAENPALLTGIGRMTRHLSQERAVLDAEADRLLAAATGYPPSPPWAKGFSQQLPGEVLPLRLDLPLLRVAPPAVLSRAIKKLLRTAGVAVDTERLDRVVAALFTPGSLSIDGSHRLVCTETEGLFFTDRQWEEIPVRRLSAPDFTGRYPLGNGRWLEISENLPTEGKFFVNNPTLQYENAANCDKIEQYLILRSRATGDTLRLAGRSTQTLKKKMNAMGVSPGLRQSLLVIADANGVLWCEGIGVAERAKSDTTTKRVLYFIITEETKHEK